jgi:hypothetical protein
VAVALPVVRFMRAVRFLKSGCWRWTGWTHQPSRKNPIPYGKFKVAGKTWLAHRWSYVAFVGPIPVGLTIDHECRKEWCVNPDRLKPKTMRDNILAGAGPAAKNARKLRCVRGHPFTVENTGRQKNGRFCKKCRREDWRRYRARQKEKAA